MFNVLEGDGIIENIYHFLWTKDTIFNTDPYVIIPQTILYKYQKPCYWYFTSIIDGKLKKKSSGKVNPVHIREVFTKHISKSGIVAYYIYKKNKVLSKYESDKPTFEKRMKTLFDKEPEEEPNKGSYIIEYFDLKKFDEFLKNKFSYEDGILQKFEDPKGDFNSTFRLTWSPKLCLFEKCTNIKKITDTKYDIYERAVTYDGEEFQTKTEPLKGSNLPDRIEKIGMSIANHVSNITLEKIKIVRMILNFKIDKKDRILFLWCSSLRIENGLDKRNINDNKRVKEVDIKKIKIRSPEDINLFKYNINGKPIKPRKDSICLNCGQKIESYRLYEINFKSLIESHENRKRDNDLFSIYNKINMTSSGVEIIPYMEENNNDALEKLKKYNYRNFIIPKVIMEIYPKMKYEDYNNLKTDSIFCAKTAVVCDSCYLDITRYCSMGGANIENILRTMKQGKIALPKLREKSVELPYNQFNKSYGFKNQNNMNINKKFTKRVSTAKVVEYRNRRNSNNSNNQNSYFNNNNKFFSLTSNPISKFQNTQIKGFKSIDRQNFKNQKNISNNNFRPETSKIRKRNNFNFSWKSQKDDFNDIINHLDDMLLDDDEVKTKNLFDKKDKLIGNDYY